MAAPTVRGVSALGSGTTSFVAAVPTGGSAPQAGDAMYIIMESSDSTTAGGTPTTPNGWSKLFENTIGAGATNVSTLTIFGKIAGASESDVTVNGVGNHCAGAMLVVATPHGLSAITDTVVGTAADHGTGTTNLLAPSINVTADSLIITVMGLSDDAGDLTNASGFVNANLADIVEQTDRTVSTGAGGGVAIYTSTCAGTTTGASEWDHDTGVQAQSVQLGIPPQSSSSTEQGLSGAGTFAPTVNRTATFGRALSGVAALVASLSRAATLARAIAGSVVGAVTLSRTATLARSVVASAEVLSSLGNSSIRQRAVTALGTFVPALGTARLKLLSMSATAAWESSIAYAKAFTRVLTATVTGSAALAKAASFARSITATLTNTATVTRRASLLRTLSSSGALSGTLSRAATLGRTLSGSVQGTASVLKSAVYARSIAAANVFLALLDASQDAVTEILLQASVVSSTAMGSVATYTRRVSAAVVTATATIGRTVVYGRTLSATATTFVSWISELVLHPGLTLVGMTASIQALPILRTWAGWKRTIRLPAHRMVRRHRE